MNAEAGRPRPILTTPRLTAGLLVLLLAAPMLLLALAEGGDGWAVLAYLALVLATIAVLRGVRREPGSWLGRRAVRRALVVAIGAVCAGLLAGVSPSSAAAVQALLLIPLVLLNIALGVATERIATAPDQSVDERQESLRNRSHRVAYWTFALLVGGTLLVADVASRQSRSWLEATTSMGGGWIVFLELMLVLPAITMAWLEPDRIAPEHAASTGSPRTRIGLAMLAVTIVTPFLFAVALTALPAQTTRSVRSSGGPVGAQCAEFTAATRVGLVVAAKIPLHAVACWDGRTATESWGLNASDCNLALSDLASVETVRCSRTTGPDGTLHYTYSALVRPQILPFVSREVTMQLVLDRDGHVVRFP
jgi:hypothetical protein